MLAGTYLCRVRTNCYSPENCWLRLFSNSSSTCRNFSCPAFHFFVASLNCTLQFNAAAMCSTVSSPTQGRSDSTVARDCFDRFRFVPASQTKTVAAVLFPRTTATTLHRPRLSQGLSEKKAKDPVRDSLPSPPTATLQQLPFAPRQDFRRRRYVTGRLC